MLVLALCLVYYFYVKWSCYNLQLALLSNTVSVLLRTACLGLRVSKMNKAPAVLETYSVDE